MIINLIYMNFKLIRCNECECSSFKLNKIKSEIPEMSKKNQILFFEMTCEKCDKEKIISVNKVSNIKVIR